MLNNLFLISFSKRGEVYGVQPTNIAKESILKLSNALTFHVDGKMYIYHGLSGVITELDQISASVLNMFQQQDTITRQELLSKIKDTIDERAIEQAIDELVQMEILIENDVKGIHSLTPGIPNVEKIPLQTLVFHLINECNLSCTYCYAGGGNYGKPMKLMSIETAEKAIDFLIQQSGDEPRISVVLFGGEPTMNWPLIKRIVEYGRKMSDKVQKTIDFSMTTNGTLLNDERIKFLTENHVGVTVSMDGPKEWQDQFRIFNNGAGSYDIVLKNAKKLIEMRPKKPVAVRVTVNKGFPSVKDLFYHFLDIGFHEVGFAPVSAADEAFVLNSPELWRLLDDFEQLAEDYVQAANNNRYLGFSNLSNILVELHFGINKGYACGAGIGFMAVSPSGELFLCHRFNEQKEYKIGDIYQGINRNFQAELLSSLHVDNKTTCSSCALKHTCSGGCYYEALERMGEITSPNLHYCQWMKKWYKIGLKTYVRIMKENPTFIDRIAGLTSSCHTS